MLRSHSIRQAGRHTSHWLVAFALAIATASSVRPAHAQDTAADDGAAKELMRRGYAALKKNDAEAAHKSFSEAWKKKRHFAIALSLAEVEMRLNRYVDAADHWQFVIRNLPDDLAEKRAEAEEQLAECKKRVGTLTVRLKPPEATLVIDGAPTADSPTDRELYLNPGDHDIRAEKDGRRSPTRSVHLSAGAKLSIELVVDDGSIKATPPPVASGQTSAPEQADRTPPTSPSTSASTSSASSLKLPVAISGLVLTLGGATVGTVFLLKKNAAADDADTAFERAIATSSPGVEPESACAVEDRPSACDEAEGRIADSRKYRNVAVGAFVGAGVIGAATIVTLLLLPSESSAKSSVALTPVVGPQLSGVSLSGRF